LQRLGPNSTTGNAAAPAQFDERCNWLNKPSMAFSTGDASDRNGSVAPDDGKPKVFRDSAVENLGNSSIASQLNIRSNGTG
jgi:hypothetical protein